MEMKEKKAQKKLANLYGSDDFVVPMELCSVGKSARLVDHSASVIYFLDIHFHASMTKMNVGNENTHAPSSKTSTRRVSHAPAPT